MSCRPSFFAALSIALVPVCAAAQPWAGFVDRSDALRTDRYSFGGSNAEAGDTNENYYDGDFADFDGDGRLDRATISRYGLLWNQGGGVMLPVANTIPGATYKFGDKDSIGNDAVMWADVDGDGDPDSIQGGNGESMKVQINSATNFTLGFQTSGSSAKRMVKIDLERDGDVDLVVAGAFCLTRNCGQPDDFTVWRNNGSGQFTDVTLAPDAGLDYRSALIAGVSAGDLDGDGDFDLALISGTRRRGLVLINSGAGQFTERVFFTIPDAVWDYGAPADPSIGMSGGDTTALGDIDDDGDLDLIVGAVAPFGGHPNVFHGLFVNDGAGNFTEQGATRFQLGNFTGKLYGTDIKFGDFDADGDLDITGYAQSGAADMQGNRLHVFLNDGAGVFTFAPGVTPSFTPPVGGINAFDVADYDGDGSLDLWVGNQGGRVLTFTNSLINPGGSPADLPRDVRVVSATDAGVQLAWRPPASASTVRFYRVYRDLAPGLPLRDRLLAKTVAITPHADDGLVAPITKRTTAGQLADLSVAISSSDGTIQWTDSTAKPGIRYFYSVVHVGHETKASEPSPQVPVLVPGPTGSDTTPPELTIVSPMFQQSWEAFPRVVLQYGDSQSGIDPSSVRVAFDAGLGLPANGGRDAGSDVSDLATWKDQRHFIAALGPPYALPVNTTVTMSASVSDLAGNTMTKTTRFFVSVTSAQLPSASFTISPDAGTAPLDITFDATASADPGGRIVRYEWYFGDGSSGSGVTASHRYNSGGSFTATLVVRDTQGGVATASRVVTLQGPAAVCTTGDVRLCYSGPGGTEGVGACRGGMQSCVAGAWAQCGGETVPAVEACGDLIDGDCDGVFDSAEPQCQVPSDAGAALDAGTQDAGSDAGAVLSDAGVDAGAATDAGPTPADGGIGTGPDAGLGQADGGSGSGGTPEVEPAPSQGCGCGSSSGVSSGVVLLLAATVLRRSRRRAG